MRYGKDVVLYSMVINNLRVFRWLSPWLGRWRCVSFLHGNETLRLMAHRPEVLRRNLDACTRVFANSRYTRALTARLGAFPNIEVIEPGIPGADR